MNANRKPDPAGGCGVMMVLTSMVVMCGLLSLVVAVAVGAIR